MSKKKKKKAQLPRCMETSWSDHSFKDTHWCYYAAAYFDLLGQSNQLASISAIPVENSPPDDASDFWKLLKATAGRIRGFRELLVSYWSASLAAEDKIRGTSDTETARLRTVLNDLRSRPLLFQGFSDTVMVFISLHGLSAPAQVAAVDTLLRSCSILMPCALAGGLAPRGAVEIGTGIEIFKGEIYGPVLLSCHTLESQVADWPRIVAGPGLADFLRTYVRTQPATPEESAARAWAASVARWIRTDDAGVLYLDYLSHHILEQFDNPLFADAVAGALNQAQARLDEFHDNPKIRGKYEKLVSYLQSFDPAKRASRSGNAPATVAKTE
jgi:hypothetical protein